MKPASVPLGSVLPVGFVLAGGRSSRMGFDKARAPVPHTDLPLAVSVLEALAPHCSSVWLIRRGEPDGLPWVRQDGTPVSVIYERDEGPRHPLVGWRTALAHAAVTPAGGSEPECPVLIAACDLPGLRAGHVGQLVEGSAPPCAIAFDGSPQPLLAIVWPVWRERVDSAIIQGGAMRHFTADARRVPLESAALANASHRTDLGVGPVSRLLKRVPVTRTGAPRAVQGELIRLRQRGVVDPSWPVDPIDLQRAVDQWFGVQ